MKTKLQLLDLVICTVWLIGTFSSTYGIYQFLLLAVFIRMVISFLLYRKEKRTLILLLAYTVCLGMHVWLGSGGGIGGICKYTIALLNSDFNARTLGFLITGFLFTWIVVVPFVYYLVMLIRHKLIRTELTTKEIFGAMMWNDRRARYYSAFLFITLISIYTGIAMNTSLCKMMCLLLAPLCYWLVCRYYGAKAEKVWLMVIAMLVFWYAQIVDGAFRIAMLAASFCMVAFVCSHVYKETRQYLMTGICTLYFAILLPSFSIGYNQYVCIDYPRMSFATLEPYHGILVIKDSTNGELCGLRDRYGLLIMPEYENIEMGDPNQKYLLEYCRLEKDGYTRIYNIYNNELLPTDRNAELQSNLCKIIENYFSYIRNDTSDIDYDYENFGEIKVTDLSRHKVIGHVRIRMNGNPVRIYDDSFLANDTTMIASGNYLRKDSVMIREMADYCCYKNILCYSENIPNDSCRRYNVYIRLGLSAIPIERDVESIMAEVRKLKVLNNTERKL